MSGILDIKVDLRRIPKKVQAICDDPRVLKELGLTWDKYFKEFMPHGTGSLQNSAHVTSDGYIIYVSDYAHYWWKGDEYVYSMERDETTGEIVKNYYAPKDGKKFPSGDSLLSLEGVSPNYTPQWNQTAYQVYKSEVAEHMTEFIKEL